MAWYRKAADQGNSFAQKSPGVMYYKGQGLDQSYNTALKWYRMAEENEQTGAQELVAKLKATNPPAGKVSKQCANCGALEAPGGASLKPCARCEAAVYSGKECQKKDWNASGGNKSPCLGFSG